MIDAELSRAVRLLQEARLADFDERHRRQLRPRISVEDRFMAAMDSSDAARLLPLAEELLEGAYAVRAERFENYRVALRNWMNSHEEIDPDAWRLTEGFLVGMNIH